jgi:hypothetical protein
MNKFFVALNFFCVGGAFDQMISHTGSPLAPFWFVVCLILGALNLAGLQSKTRQPCD